MIELVGGDIRELLDRRYPERIIVDDAPVDAVVAPNSGVLIGIDRDRLVMLAADADCVLHVLVALGGFVPAGAPLVRVEGAADRVDRASVLGALRSGLERTMDEDLAYGFRLLVDMAERSLSESPFADPTTAVQCIDRLHDGLRQLAGRRLADGRLYDETGRLRVTVPTMDWDAYVALAFNEIRLAGVASPQVTRRLNAALDDLIDHAPAERRPVLVEQRELLQEAICKLSV